MKIKSYTDIKSEAIKKDIKLTSDLPKMFGYSSLYGFKLALKNKNKKEKLFAQATEIFLKN